MAGRGCKGAEANRFVGLGAGAVTGVGGVTAETGGGTGSSSTVSSSNSEIRGR